MKYFNRIVYITLIGLCFFSTACNKTTPYETTIPESQSHFVGARSRTDSVIVDPAPVSNITVGSTDVSASDRVVTYTISSPSGATTGVQYTDDGNGKVTIPAGKAIATIDIRPIYSAYANGRKDTLIFVLSTPDMKPAEFMDTAILILAGRVPCDETSPTIDLSTLLGNYDNTNEDFDGNLYGPYTTSISSAVQTGPTTGTIVVQNIYDDGWGPITFNLDWSDPANKTCIVVDGIIPGTDAGTVFGPTYNGISLIVTEPFGSIGSSPVGSFVYCQQRFSLQLEIGIDGVGYYPHLYTVNLAR